MTIKMFHETCDVHKNVSGQIFFLKLLKNEYDFGSRLYDNSNKY